MGRDSFPTRCAASVKMPDELEERLQKHARNFDGLLSLIPAKLYYGEDVSDQWKKSRLSGLDADKQERIASQDMWMNARKRASGEKVKDDTSLLKKALKRHEGQKKKSEKEWTERDEGIKKSIEVRQKKRTENLAKRKDEKGKGKGKKVKRPGFEGSFKGRTGGKKGKA